MPPASSHTSSRSSRASRPRCTAGPHQQISRCPTCRRCATCASPRRRRSPGRRPSWVRPLPPSPCKSCRADLAVVALADRLKNGTVAKVAMRVAELYAAARHAAELARTGSEGAQPFAFPEVRSPVLLPLRPDPHRATLTPTRRSHARRTSCATSPSSTPTSRPSRTTAARSTTSARTGTATSSAGSSSPTPSSGR